MKKQYKIAGVYIDNLSYKEVLLKIDKIVSGKKKSYIVTVNPEMLINANKDNAFMDVLRDAEIRTADGIGILWAANFLYNNPPKSRFLRYTRLLSSLMSILIMPKKIRGVIKERVTGSDLMPKIIDYSQKKGWRIFLLGASEGIAEIAAENLSRKYPKAIFAGCLSGSPNAEDDKKIRDHINQVKPDIIFVAYGSPKQEYWMRRNIKKLDSANITIGVGGAFDFYAGKIKRAPNWMRMSGIEWLWRLIIEPKRATRIWNATAVFIGTIAKNGIRK